MKLFKSFQFIFPYNKIVFKNGRKQYEHIADLTIEGVAEHWPNVSKMEPAHDRFNVDIDFVKYNGIDVKPLLEESALMDEISDAAFNHAAFIFDKPVEETEEEKIDSAFDMVDYANSLLKGLI